MFGAASTAKKFLDSYNEAIRMRRQDPTQYIFDISQTQLKKDLETISIESIQKLRYCMEEIDLIIDEILVKKI